MTTSSDSTESRVWPYFTQHRPPAFVPRLPPIEHISKLTPGRAGRTGPRSATAALSARVDDPGLDDGDEVLAVDLEDPVHRRERDRQAALDPGRAAGQAGAGAARDDRDAMLGRRAAPASATSAVSVGSATAPGRPGRRYGVSSAGRTRDRSRRSAGAGRAARRGWRRSSGPMVMAGSVEGHRGRIRTMATTRAIRRCAAPAWSRVLALAIAASRCRVGRGRVARRADPAAPRRVAGRRRRRSSPGAVEPLERQPRRATYDARLKLNWARASDPGRRDASSITNTSGGPIDRVELNTIAARLGGDAAATRSPSTASRSTATVSDQTIVVPARRRPAGRRHRPRSASAIGATLRTSLGRLELAVHEGERHRRPLPLAAVGQPQDAVRPAEPRRPVRDAVEPVRPGHDRDRPASSTSPRPATACRRVADGLTQRLRGAQRPRLHGHRRHRLPDARADRRATTSCASTTGPARPAPRCSTRAADAFKALRGAARAVPATRSSRSSSRPAATGWSRRGSSGSRPASAARNLRYLVGPRDRPPVVLRARRQRPGARAVRRRGRGRLHGPLRDRHRSARAAAPTGRLDRSIYHYTARCYYEKVYIQGGNLLDAARERMGSTRVLGGAARVRGRPTGSG